MSDESTPMKRATTRKRGAIYGERKVVTLRVPDDLHTEMIQCADHDKVSVNDLVLRLVRAELTKRARLSRAKVGG